jgi:hypothetical protein
LFADDETVETDADVFDCQACPVVDALDGLWPENRAAWTLSRQILSRFTYDTRSVALALDRATRDLDPAAWLELVERLAMIYDFVYPPPTAPAES